MRLAILTYTIIIIIIILNFISDKSRQLQLHYHYITDGLQTIHYIHSIWHRFRLPLCSIVAVKSPLTTWCLFLLHSFSVTSANITVDHLLLKTKFFELHFCRKDYGSSFNRFGVTVPQRSFKLTDFTGTSY